MKTRLLLLVALPLILFTAFPASAQKLKSRYDKFKDQTETEINFTSAGLWHSLLITHSGQKPNADAHIEWVISSLAFDTHDKDPRSMTLLLDGQRVSMKGEFDPTPAIQHHYIGTVDFRVMLTPELLDTLIKAKTIEGQIGRFEFKLKPEHQRNFAAALNYVRSN